ncbi:MAG: YlmC/YmxH family sporulation protein [Clostridia bacterium]|nr:YlmC/YmxH family sporulation protein [Clostridia bacterium]
MILSYKELRKRDVVNMVDGRSFGKLTDLKLDFPCGNLKGIVVCDKKRGGLFNFWNKNEIYIDEKNIIKIGGDVILVNLKIVNEFTPAAVEVGQRGKEKCVPSAPVPPCPAPKPCPPSVPPCPPPCQPRQNKPFRAPTAESDEYFIESAGMDFEDY